MGSLYLNRVIKSLRAFCLLVPMALAATAVAQPPVTPFTLDYRLKSDGIPFSITATRTLERVKGGLWKMEVSAKNRVGISEFESLLGGTILDMINGQEVGTKDNMVKKFYKILNN